MSRLRAVIVVLCCGWAGPASPDSSVDPPKVTIPCQTVADCWLDSAGHAIARPRRKRGQPIPRGDCGGNIVWLRNRLMCIDHVCAAVHIGDRC